jgi:AcrR family transcriptional regulator
MDRVTTDTRRTRSGRRPGRPRQDDVDERVLSAGLEELARGGFSHFSVSAVARRAGVAKGTIYLRWPTREQLILDVSATIVANVTLPPTGTLSEQLEDLVAQWEVMLGEPHTTRLLQRLGADRDEHPELYADFYERVQAVANRVVEETIVQAQERGEANPDVDAKSLTRIFVGALYVEALRHVPAGQLAPAFTRDLIGLFLLALAPPPGTADDATIRDR